MLVADEENLCVKAELEAGARLGCTASMELVVQQVRYVCTCTWVGSPTSSEEKAWDQWLQHIILDKGASPEYPPPLL